MPANWMKHVSIFILLACFAAPIQAEQEKILDYHVDILVNKNASINVTETITAYAAGIVIKRGLLRSLPTYYKDSYGIPRSVKYNLDAVTVDGYPSAYHTQHAGNAFKIYVGDKNVFLKPNVYVYQFRYHINDAINFLKDADEIYWNITGNDWAFPIERASANITLPEGATISLYTGYTGRKGDKGKNYTSELLATNRIAFTTLRALPARNGLTIGVAWQKGVVIEPNWRERILYQFQAYPYAPIPIAIALAVLIYYMLAWYRVGRDPDEGTIIPLFVPPENLSAPACRYITDMGYDNKTLTAAIVSLAVKGALEIKDTDNEFTLIKKQINLAQLFTEESELYQRIFLTSDTLTLTQKNASRVQSARANLKNSLSSRYKGNYFVTNIYYAIPGILLTLAAFIATMFTSSNIGESIFALVWLTGWTIACFFLTTMAYRAISAAISFRSIKTISAAVFASLFSIPFLGGLVAGVMMFSEFIPLFLLLVLFATALVNVTFIALLRAPTQRGRKIMDQIEGFRRFLATTEKYRLQQMHAPEVTPELFEKYLPYAIALNVETKWGEKFDTYVQAAGLSQQNYQPIWYSGRSFSTGRVCAFSAFIGSGINSSLQTASVSSSSSGSGGGGFSGGGGGGGGGGGW